MENKLVNVEKRKASPLTFKIKFRFNQLTDCYVVTNFINESTFLVRINEQIRAPEMMKNRNFHQRGG
jgi:hypothetical protein